MNLRTLLFNLCIIGSSVNINSESKNLSILGPYNSTEKSNYIELILVIDNKVFKSFDSDSQKVHKFSKDLINHVNSLFVHLNIFIALTEVVIWTEQDQIKISSEGDQTLRNFLAYRRQSLVVDHPNDYAVLLTGQKFDGGIIEKTLRGPICTYE